MDKDKITELLNGVTMDGTTFDFQALCSSVSKMVVIHLVVEWIREKIEKEYPVEQHNDPELFKKIFAENRSTIAQVVWEKYSEVYSKIKDSLIDSIYECE